MVRGLWATWWWWCRTTGVLVLTRHKEANRAFKAALQDKQGAQVWGWR